MFQVKGNLQQSDLHAEVMDLDPRVQRELVLWRHLGDDFAYSLDFIGALTDHGFARYTESGPNPGPDFRITGRGAVAASIADSVPRCEHHQDRYCRSCGLPDQWKGDDALWYPAFNHKDNPVVEQAHRRSNLDTRWRVWQVYKDRVMTKTRFHEELKMGNENSKGYTIVELMIVLAVFSIAACAVAGLVFLVLYLMPILGAFSDWAVK